MKQKQAYAVIPGQGTRYVEHIWKESQKFIRVQTQILKEVSRDISKKKVLKVKEEQITLFGQ